MVPIDIGRDVKFICGWNYYTMRFMGIWPQNRKWNDPSSYIALIAILLMLSFICVPQTTDLFYIWGDLDLVVENLILANLSVMLALLKTIIFWCNGKSLKSLLMAMNQDWNSMVKHEDRSAMMKIAKITRKIVATSTVLCFILVAIFIVMRYFLLRSTGQRIFFRASIPYDPDVTSQSMLMIVGQFFAAMYAVTTYTAVDTFVAMLVLHVCGQLTYLRQELRNLSAKNRTEFRIKLTNIVRKHEEVNWFGETVESCFNMMLLMQMLGCTGQVCLQSFQVIMSASGKATEALFFQLCFFIFYVIYILLQLYLYCYVGEKLSVESTKIGYAAYECKWYDLSVNDAKLLILFMRRSMSPLHLTAGRFCVFNLALYSQILKTSMGYLSVLYAAKNK